MNAPVRELAKYLQISHDIVAMIQSGALGVGEQAPSENEIIQEYGVSNTTARKALQEIERSGWVTRVKGRGTYVRDKRVGRSVDRILGFTRNMIEAGRTPLTQVLRVRVRQAGRSTRFNGRTYRMAGPICVIERLRLADGDPMVKETRFISLNLCPGIEEENLEGSLYDLYEQKYGLQLVEIHQRVSAMILDRKRDLDLFGLDDIAPAFLVEGATFCGKESILDMEEALYRGDRYQFSVKATR